MNQLILAASIVALLSLRQAVAADVDARNAHRADKDHPAGFDPKYADKQAWEKRADALRNQVLVALGLWPMPEKHDLNAVIHGRIERDGFTVEKVYFASLPGHYVTGNLYRPIGRTGKLPAVVSPYGHWPNGRFIYKSDADIKKTLDEGSEVDADSARSPLQARCAMLARMGVVVFHYDLVGYCDSKPIEHREGFTDAEAVLRAQSTMGLQAWNSIRAVDFVLSLPEVDASRVAVTGASGGATQSIVLSAVDPRVCASFPVVMISMNMQGGCVCENAPLLRIGTNNVELAALSAPRPLGAAAAKDWTSDFETRGLPELKRIYGLYDASDLVSGKFFPYGHNYNLHSRELMYQFMNGALKLGLPGPIHEVPIAPLPPEQLTVWDAQHPLPEDAADAKTLRAEMTRESDRQIDSIAQNPQAWRTMMSVAVRAMIADSMPSAEDVEIVEGHDPSNSDKTEWRGAIGRRGQGEHVSSRALLPNGERKRIVLLATKGGCAGLSDEDGSPTKSVATLLAAGAIVLAVDPFERAAPPVPKSPLPYPNIWLTYERTEQANRARDILTTLAFAKRWGEDLPIDLIADESAAVQATLAGAIARDLLDAVSVDVGSATLDMPASLKYGGLMSVATLLPAGRSRIGGAAAPTDRYTRNIENVVFDERKGDLDRTIDWVLAPSAKRR